MTNAYSAFFDTEDGAGKNIQILAKKLLADASDLVRFQIIEPQIEDAVERFPFIDSQCSEVLIMG